MLFTSLLLFGVWLLVYYNINTKAMQGAFEFFDAAD